MLLCRQFGEDGFQKEQLKLTQMNCKIVFGLKALLTEVLGSRRGGTEEEELSSQQGCSLHSLGNGPWPSLLHIPDPT